MSMSFLADEVIALGGYAYFPHALDKAPKALTMAERFHVQLMDGQLQAVKQSIAEKPERLAELLPIVANPEASINVRLGASVIFEGLAGTPALRALVSRLGELAAHADARVRADACFFLGLSGDPRGRVYLEPRLQDADAEVREIAVDSLEELAATGDGLEKFLSPHQEEPQ